MKLGEEIRSISAELSDITEDAALEARLIIQKATGLSRPVLLTHPERELTAPETAQIEELCLLRLEGHPLPYLLGEWEFYGHPFCVDPSVLIPRPETELLCEKVIEALKDKIGNIKAELDKMLSSAQGAMEEEISAEKLQQINNIMLELEKASVNLGSSITAENRDETPLSEQQ